MKTLKTLIVLALITLAMTACAPLVNPSVIQTSQAVQIPIELQLALNAVLLFGVTFGLQWLFEKVNIDLRGIGTAVAMAVSEFVILQVQGWINLVPVQYDIYITLGFGIILSVLTTLGYVRVAFQRSRAAAMFDRSIPRDTAYFKK